MVFSLIYGVNMLYKLFPNNPDDPINIFVFDYRPMSHAWACAYICSQVVQPLLVALGIQLIARRSKIDTIYRIELNLYMLFVILDSISFFLWFKSGAEYSYIYWVMAIAAVLLWYRKDNIKKITSNE